MNKVLVYIAAGLYVATTVFNLRYDGPNHRQAFEIVVFTRDIAYALLVIAFYDALKRLPKEWMEQQELEEAKRYR